MSSLPLIHDLDLKDLQSKIDAWGEPAYRTRQIWHALYHSLDETPSEMTVLPAALRTRLAESFRFAIHEPLRYQRSSDGNTEKVLLALDDGQSVEAVLMHYDRRRTACISTQVGCAMGCQFCATGQMGFQRNLSAGEIVLQALHFARHLRHDGQRLDNIVVMGMGEPLRNYQSLAQALRLLKHAQGFRFGARRITVSTVGLVPGIVRFTRDFPQVNLAVSLHAATNEIRDQLVPANKRYPLEPLLAACRAHVDQTGRRITFEWALIKGLNDSPEQAQALASLVRGLRCHVNLIPLNPTSPFPGEASSQARCAEFADVLTQRRISNSVRVRRGIDIQAGCGQLATQQ